MAQANLGRLSGALVVLASRHSAGDFGFVPYCWTASERSIYLAAGKPPVTVHDLPAQMPALPVYAFARDVACDWRGPMLSGADFRRVNSWKAPRLVVFDGVAASAEHPDIAGPLFVVPTTDLCIHPAQLRLFEENVNVDKSKDERHARVPLLRELLHGGCNITDYVITGEGPAIYQEGSGSGWAKLWTLLDRFAGTSSFDYPDRTHRRLPQEFRVTVQQLHERSWEEANDAALGGAAHG
ncbi:hypothetical protein P171DRAFT_34233 [Karstenula rhodostoma CBS 690.94]|uniref:Uncharacterized protein n=1 Tax=Karstenula rhodostoma CBS 690.94 TaxID=1392251 RepID=A0A9P4PI88_9PLEO|nr:hypothetical protein P171DRAFT_34233 [Karstenula rhodostoma CBS 690.94]